MLCNPGESKSIFLMSKILVCYHLNTIVSPTHKNQCTTFIEVIFLPCLKIIYEMVENITLFNKE